MRNALSASSSWLSLIVAPIILWGSFYEQRRPGSTFTIRSDHMRGWITSPRSNLLSNTSWRIFLHSPYCDVYFSRDWTLFFFVGCLPFPLSHCKNYREYASFQYSTFHL